jgi:glycogen synthase
MLGWEFPPYISGGLGTACHGLTRALTRLDTEILFVLPRAETAGPQEVAAPDEGRRVQAGQGPMTFAAVPSAMTRPYASGGCGGGGGRMAAPPGDLVPTMMTLRKGPLSVIGAGAAGGYEGDLIHRIEQYAERCVDKVRGERFDVIHAHDWVTLPAGEAIAARSHRPLVAHIHSTEFDRSGERVNPPVYDIERRGMEAADGVIAVSRLTRRMIVERYGIAPQKVRVIHNGIDPTPPAPRPRVAGRPAGEKTVLFLGRLTMQKGASFFVRAAARILERRRDVRFVIVGWGDLGPQIVEQVAALGLGAQVRFAGFLRGDEVEQAYRMADVYVMPSVSEPFGLTALEAVRHGVPVILSKNSGVAEVLPRGALKVDFWDIEKMADRILAVLDRPALGEALRRAAGSEVRKLTWEAAARKCLEVYEERMALGVN